MKKLIALLLVLTMLFSVATLFAGCEDDGGKKKSSSKHEDDEDDEDDEEENEDADDDKDNGEDENNEDEDKNGKDNKQEEKPTEPTEYEFDDSDGNGPLLYKVSDEKGNVIWLLGSIHVGRDDYYPLPDYVMDAFEGSDALAVEADIISFETDQVAQTQALMMMMYTDGTKIADHISDELYEEAVALMTEYGQYNILLDYFMPITWYQTINSLSVVEAGGNVSLGIDRYFLNYAKETDMKVLEVESAEFQYGMMADFSEELQILMLQSTVDNFYEFDEMRTDLKELMDLWQSGNEAAFAEYLAQSSDIPEGYQNYENLDALLEEYNNAMIVERNQSMTEYAIDALESGEEIFICVGAAHVVGEDAMADNLRELGYTVEIVR